MMINAELECLIEVLNEADSLTYYTQDLGGPIDLKIFNSLAKFKNYSSHELKACAQSMAVGHAQILGVFAERMASLTVRQAQEEFAEMGLFGLVIYSARADERDAILLLSILFDAVKRIGRIPESLIRTVSAYFGGVVFLEQYVKRQAKDQSIEDMGYETVLKDGKFFYQRTW